MIGRSAIWVTWERQQRNHSLSELLGVPLYEIISKNKGGFRYAESLVKTIGLIRSKKPETVFCQNPSIVLSFLCVLLHRIFSYAVIVDEHNEGLLPLNGRNRVLSWFARYIVRNASAVIVTNDALAQKCRSWGGRALVIQDPLPKFSIISRREVNEANLPFRIVFICTWASDEPYKNVIEAAKSFPAAQLSICITGKYHNKIAKAELPGSVELMGFLCQDDYVEMLANCHGVIVLTTREDCLNCGAYEAVSLLKPGILSDTPALRSYFSKGFVFTDNSPEDIARSIGLLMDNIDAYRREIGDLKSICEMNDIMNQQKMNNFLKNLP